jgi:hypothetical protein
VPRPEGAREHRSPRFSLGVMFFFAARWARRARPEGAAPKGHESLAQALAWVGGYKTARPEGSPENRARAYKVKVALWRFAAFSSATFRAHFSGLVFYRICSFLVRCGRILWHPFRAHCLLRTTQGKPWASMLSCPFGAPERPHGLTTLKCPNCRASRRLAPGPRRNKNTPSVDP